MEVVTAAAVSSLHNYQTPTECTWGSKKRVSKRA